MLESIETKALPRTEFTAGEIIWLVPGLDRGTLHRWRKSGYINPERRKIGEKHIYFYGESELPLIRQMFELVSAGYAPRKAFRKVVGTPERSDRTEDEYALVSQVVTLLSKVLVDAGTGKLIGKELQDVISRTAGDYDLPEELNTATVLTLVVLNALLTGVPLGTNPPKIELARRLEDVGKRCGAPSSLVRQLFPRVEELYTMEVPAAALESFRVREFWEMVTNDGNVSISASQVQRIVDAMSGSGTDARPYDLLLRLNEMSSSFLYVGGDRTQLSPRLATFLRRLLEARGPVRYADLVRTTLEPEEHGGSALQNAAAHQMKLRLCHQVEWLKTRIRHGSKPKSYEVDHRVKFCILRLVVQTPSGRRS